MHIQNRLDEIKKMDPLPKLVEQNRLVAISQLIDDFGPVSVVREIDLLFEDFLILNSESYGARDSCKNGFSIDPHMLNTHSATLKRIKDLLLDIHEFEEHYYRVEKEKEALEQKKVA